MNLFYKSEKKLSKNCLRAADFYNNLLAVGTLDKKVILSSFSQDSQEEIAVFDFFESPVYSLKFIGTNLLAIGCTDKKVYLVNHNGDLESIFEGHQGIISSICWNEKHMATGSWDATCKIWDLETK